MFLCHLIKVFSFLNVVGNLFELILRQILFYFLHIFLIFILNFFLLSPSLNLWVGFYFLKEFIDLLWFTFLILLIVTIIIRQSIIVSWAFNKLRKILGDITQESDIIFRGSIIVCRVYFVANSSIFE